MRKRQGLKFSSDWRIHRLLIIRQLEELPPYEEALYQHIYVHVDISIILSPCDKRREWPIYLHSVHVGQIEGDSDSFISAPSSGI
jgi:hypothetical protein